MQIRRVALAAIALFLHSSSVLAYTTGLELGSGPIQVKSTVPEEFNKTGTLRIMRILLETVGSFGDVGLALGLQSSQVQGDDLDTGYRQTYKLQSPTFDLMAHARVYNGLFAGMIFRNQFGRGASYGIEDEDRFVYVSSVGPSILYRFDLGKFTLAPELDLLFNQSGKERTVKSQMIGISLTYDKN